VRALRGVRITAACFLAAVVGVSWDANWNETSGGTPHADPASFPHFGCELIIVSHECIYPKASLAAVERLGFVLGKSESLTRRQWHLPSLFDDEFKRDDIRVCRTWEIGSHLSADRFDAEGSQFQGGSADVLYDDDGSIVPVWNYSRDSDSGLRWLKLEINPREDGRFYGNQDAELRESGIGNFCCGLRLFSQRAFLCHGSFVQSPHGSGIVACSGEKVLHVINLDARVSLQSMRSAPKIESEDSKGDCRERSDRPFILVSEISSANTNETRPEIKPRDPGDGPGVTFVKGLIGIAILVGMYTAFKRLGWLDDDDDHKDTGRPKRRPRDPSP
jgi:hypothetical protein